MWPAVLPLPPNFEADRMAAILPAPNERARKNERAILQALASRGQVAVAESLNVSESTISRMKEGEITRMSVLLSALGLKVVPIELKCYRPRDIEMLMHGARSYFERLEGPEQLEFDE
jgi:Ran GTPase-activating protein (RanGAP) involved in mRNA processing and transport